MPPYNFPTSEELLRELFPNYQSQSPTPQNATDIQNDATVKGLQQKINEQTFLDPVARQKYLPQILASKRMYEMAGNPNYQQQLGMSQEQIQNQANANANKWRQEANDAGFDLSNYGEAVSLNDAYQNLATNDARAAVDLAQGKYSMTADQYFSRQYDELLRQGHSARRAKAIAADMAMKYKGERVAHLNGMINGYGFEGNVATPVGRRAIADLIAEAPQMASYYNTLQREGNEQENALTQTVLNNQGSMDRLLQTISGEMARLNRAGEIDVGKMALQDSLNRSNTVFNNQQEIQQQRAMNKLASEQRESDFWQQYRLAGEIGTRFGLSGKALTNFQAMALNLPTLEKVDSKVDIKNFQDYYKERMAGYNKTLEQYVKLKENGTADEATLQKLEGDLTKAQQEIEMLNNVQNNYFGVNPQYGVSAANSSLDAGLVEGIIKILDDASKAGISNYSAYQALNKFKPEDMSDEEFTNHVKEAEKRRKGGSG